jgi:hypothetical protein
VKRKIIFAACLCLMMILFIVKNDSSEELTLDQMMGQDNQEMLFKVYNNENYQKALKLWLPFLNKRGFLDTMMKKEN